MSRRRPPPAPDEAAGGARLPSGALSRNRIIDDPRLLEQVRARFLVDTWCLGVKNAMGPNRVGRRELEALGHRCYAPWRSPGIRIPLELAQHLVLGAVEFARRARLRGAPGLQPCPPSAGQLGGAERDHVRDGRQAALHQWSLRRSAARAGDARARGWSGRLPLHSVVGRADDLGEGYRYSAVLTDRDDYLRDVA